MISSAAWDAWQPGAEHAARAGSLGLACLERTWRWGRRRGPLLARADLRRQPAERQSYASVLLNENANDFNMVMILFLQHRVVAIAPSIT